MSNSAFDYVEEHIEQGLPVVWPSEIFEILNDLEVEEPLNLSSKYKGFLEAVRRSEQEKLTPAGPVPRLRV
ncbi:hypothetical protein IAQ61_001940 [Plenodomus lingam]|nr:hypothetical protein IAQ61_001940 [Plenodomus lingam]